MEPGTSFVGTAALAEAELTDTEAERYLFEVADDFHGLSRRIIDMQHRAALVAGRAREVGRFADYENAKQLIVDLGDLNQRYGRAQDTWSLVNRWVPGLGAIPFFLVAIVTGLAAYVAAIFRQAALESQRLELLEEGVLTADELAAIQGGGIGQLAQLAPLAVAGALAWMVWKRGLI